jgi:hypothetical protein
LQGNELDYREHVCLSSTARGEVGYKYMRVLLCQVVRNSERHCMRSVGSEVDYKTL